MIDVTIKITGDKETIRKLKGLKSSLINFSGAMRKIGREVVSYAGGEVFASQGGVLGHNWPRLARSTTKQKIRYYPAYATSPLIATGTMRKSFKSNPSARSVTIRNTAPQFPYHNSRAPRRKIPYRPMLLVNNAIKQKVQRIMEDDVADKIRRA